MGGLRWAGALSLVIMVLVLVHCPTFHGAPEKRAPNVVVVLTDDQGSYEFCVLRLWWLSLWIQSMQPSSC